MPPWLFTIYCLLLASFICASCSFSELSFEYMPRWAFPFSHHNNLKKCLAALYIGLMTSLHFSSSTLDKISPFPTRFSGGLPSWTHQDPILRNLGHPVFTENNFNDEVVTCDFCVRERITGPMTIENRNTRQHRWSIRCVNKWSVNCM